MEIGLILHNGDKEVHIRNVRDPWDSLVFLYPVVIVSGKVEQLNANRLTPQIFQEWKWLKNYDLQSILLRTERIEWGAGKDRADQLLIGIVIIMSIYSIFWYNMFGYIVISLLFSSLIPLPSNILYINNSLPHISVLKSQDAVGKKNYSSTL